MRIGDRTLYTLYTEKHARNQNKGATWCGLRQKDTERSKTYEAEWTFQSKITNPEFTSIKDAEKFAKKVYKSKTWSNLWAKSVEEDVGRIFNNYPTVVQSKSRSKKLAGSTDGKVVSLDLISGLNVYTLLHELAHTLGHMHHGRSFRQTLLTLVGQFMGAKEKKTLKEEFKKKKLHSGDAKKPQEFDKWVETKERLEKMRDDKWLADNASKAILISTPSGRSFYHD